jgi:hypothetical protein
MHDQYQPDFKNLQKDIERYLTSIGKREKRNDGMIVFRGYEDALQLMFKRYLAAGALEPFAKHLKTWNWEHSYNDFFSELTAELKRVDDWFNLELLWGKGVIQKRRKQIPHPIRQQIPLKRGIHGGLQVAPRRLRRRVWISPEALSRLQDAQQSLPSNIQLILLRGYEPGSIPRRLIRRLNRNIGSILFQVIFPSRASEASEIFHPNGHDIDGNHIDVALAVNGKRLQTLPFDVFTPARLIERNSQDTAVEVAWKVLSSVGFEVHRNKTEALQIHCDLPNQLIKVGPEHHKNPKALD